MTEKPRGKLTEEEKKALDNLAKRLRVLRPEAKYRYLHYLDAEQTPLHGEFDIPSTLAYDMYYSLEGVPYVQSEFPSMMTQREIQERTKLDMLHFGVVAYRKASDGEKCVFKRSLYKDANLFSKMAYVFKMYRNGLT